jgi:hypothetical protein
MGTKISEALVRSTIERLTEICDGLPECEIVGDQHRKVTVAGRAMGWYTVDHHGDGRISLSIRAAKGENEALVASDPDTFFMPPYVARHGYVGVHLDRPEVDWEEIRELVNDAYIIAAPKRLSKLLVHTPIERRTQPQHHS